LNEAENFRALTFDSEMGSRKTYTPDIVILNQCTNTAHVVDAKRSVYTYDRMRLDDLQKRMKAAGLVRARLSVQRTPSVWSRKTSGSSSSLPDNRKDRSDHGGIWHVSQLDHLVQVEGAGTAIASLQAEFHSPC
jgi:hypothetical protein